MTLGHAIIVGQTMSGKTTLAKRMASAFRQRGVGVVVLDPLRDEWDCDVLFRYSQTFLSYARDPRMCARCALFIDESSMSLGLFDSENSWITCQSRHHGHVAHLISQRAQQISTTIRSQCSRLYCFSVSGYDAKLYARDFNCEMIEQEAPSLRQGEYIYVSRFEKPVKMSVF